MLGYIQKSDGKPDLQFFAGWGAATPPLIHMEFPFLVEGGGTEDLPRTKWKA